MGNYLEDVERRIDQERAKAQQRKAAEQAKEKAQQERAKAIKRDKQPNIFF